MRLALAVGLAVSLPITAQPEPDPAQADEDYIHTPAGFEVPGIPAHATAPDAATLTLRFIDDATSDSTPCRVNVVGPDGNFYQPEENRFTQYALTGDWPKTGKGNRRGKSPVRYLGRFFYSDGVTSIKVPPGAIHVEVWKGFEYEPTTLSLTAEANESREVEVRLRRSMSMAALGYYSGDTHLHLDRAGKAHEETAFDLLEAEDVRYGGILCYNNPTSSYIGKMSAQEFPQLLGLGVNSMRRRGDYQIISGQEYRSGHYGHTKIFLADEMVAPDQSYDPNTWPVFGEAVADIRSKGGLVFWAHGGYSKEIWANYILGRSDGVELLQFGTYRPIGLEGWYRILNIGFPYPALGASDFPPCRKFADCRTYVHSETEPRIDDWLRRLARGHSFFTTGPLLLLEVDGAKPSESVRFSGDGPHKVTVRARARCEVAPITDFDLIVNGQLHRRRSIEAGDSMGRWIEWEEEIEIAESSWIAARIHSKSPSGSPDAEAHTNPVHVYLDGKAPYDESDYQWLLEQLDGQIALHRKRSFPLRTPAGTREKVIAYFEKARTALLGIAERGGRKAP